VDDHVKKNMSVILKEIQSGKFADEWMAECKNGMPNMNKMRHDESELQIEKVGAELRRMFAKK